MIPMAIFAVAFLAVPLVQLAASAAAGEMGWGIYAQIIKTPRYLDTMLATVLLSAMVTLATLAVCLVVGLFLARHDFRGRGALISILTMPLAFPGVVVGFMIILLAGRQGLLNQILPGRVVFAYSMPGLFLGYLYFSIPRVLVTVMAAAEKLDASLEEAARTLGAPGWRVLVDVILPGLAPALIAAGAIVFATSMGAFGTAFTLATDIDVLPMVVYTEFTLQANIAMAAALSVIMGAATWAILLVARSLSGNTTAMGG
jgi:putative spermidine/putrescine transport system permease protein